MITNQPSEKDGDLDQVLKQWSVDAPLPPRFQEQVWNRIAGAEAEPEVAIGFWTWVRRIVEANLPRPKFAYAYIAILLLLGVVSGTWAAQRQANRLNADLGSRYVQSVDPYHHNRAIGE